MLSWKTWFLPAIRTVTFSESLYFSGSVKPDTPDGLLHRAILESRPMELFGKAQALFKK